MKYVSCEALKFTWEKETEAAICFRVRKELDPIRGEGRLLWVPKSQIKIGANDSDSPRFFIRSFYFMTHLRHKLHDPYTRHYEASVLAAQYSTWIDATEKELVFA